MVKLRKKCLHAVKGWILLDLKGDNWRAIVQPDQSARDYLNRALPAADNRSRVHYYPGLNRLCQGESKPAHRMSLLTEPAGKTSGHSSHHPGQARPAPSRPGFPGLDHQTEQLTALQAIPAP